jgi:glutamate synthase (ferredoxin)
LEDWENQQNISSKVMPKGYKIALQRLAEKKIELIA